MLSESVGIVPEQRTTRKQLACDEPLRYLVHQSALAPWHRLPGQRAANPTELDRSLGVERTLERTLARLTHCNTRPPVPNDRVIGSEGTLRRHSSAVYSLPIDIRVRRGTMSRKETPRAGDILQGTLDMLILRTLVMGPRTATPLHR